MAESKTELEKFITTTLKTAEDKYCLALGLEHPTFFASGKVFKDLSKLVPAITHENLSICRAEAAEGKVVPGFPMAERELLNWCKSIKRRLRRKGARKNPWLIEFSRDVDEQVFDIVLSIASSNSYETKIEQTTQQTKIIITHMKKLVFVLKRGAGEKVKEFLERSFMNRDEN